MKIDISVKKLLSIERKTKNFESNSLQSISDLNCSLLFPQNIHSIIFTLPLKNK